jgi:hypothetical protein
MARPPRNLEIAFTDGAQTHFGGVYFLQQFVQLLQLPDHLAWGLKDRRPRTRYSIAQVILAQVYPLILGLDRLEAASFLRSNGVFRYLTGLPQVPNPTTLRRCLHHASPALAEQLARVNDRLVAALLPHPHPRSRLILDLDTTVLPVYGGHDAATRAYNPKRRGARSYEPLLAVESASGLLWAGGLRPGGNPGNDEVVPLLDRAWRIAPATVREWRIRADHAFYSDASLRWMEDHHAQYAVVARLTRPLRDRLVGLRYSRLDERWAFAQTRYQAAGWSESRRIIAVRRRLTDTDDVPTLFSLGRYTYQAYVTNLDVSPERVWRFYNDRARIELIIKELKGDYALGHLPTRRFAANILHFEILRLAYNLVVGFQTLCLPSDWASATLSSIRADFLLLPAILVRPQGRPSLRFPRHLPQRALLECVIDRLRQLQGRPLW